MTSPMIKTLQLATKDRERLEEVIGVAARFGLDALLAQIGLQRGSAPGEDAPADPLARRTRLALEALGPTFVKLGQIMATRSDLLSPEWIAELEMLHSSAPTLPFEDLRPLVEKALGEPVDSAFASFDSEPLAAASMAQVHRAVTHDGNPVVLKIRRPGIRPVIEADLRLIAHLAGLAEKASAQAQRFAPAAMVRQLAAAMLEELDFTNEGRNADRLREDFRRNPKVVIPAIYWQWTTETLLVMDFVAGIPPRDAEALVSAGISPSGIAALGSEMVLDMVLVNGRFHGDPHPGNLLCLPGDRIALLDLGMIGHVSPRRREEFMSFVQALVNGNPALLADVLMRWSDTRTVLAERVMIAAEALIARHGSGRLVLADMVADFFALIRDEGMTLPPDLLLIFKALITMDGVLARIQPGFDLTDAMRGSALRIARERLSPDHWSPILQAVAWELIKIGDDAPRLIRAAIRRLEGEPNPVASPAPGPAKAPEDVRWVAAAIVAGAMVIALALRLN